MIIHARNFGKIESADIDIGDLTIFVGENNSGKTYLMQLIYGVISHIISSNINELPLDIITSDSETITIKTDDNEILSKIQNCINKFLEDKKNTIIENTFHTKNLKTDSLWIELKQLKYDYTIKFENALNLNDLLIERHISCYQISNNVSSLIFEVKSELSKDEVISVVNSMLLSIIIFQELNIENFKLKQNPMIYLPASRSGIMLLYANYLSKENDNTYKVIYNNSHIENEYGLTSPVYDFLMFLLKHKESEMLSDTDKQLLSFIDENIIHGNLAKVGNTMRYTPESSDISIPIYLSSSLVSELAPICQIISGINNISFVLYDEIETCQHPTKQRQLARMLIRMVNSGYKMIVSTHSDTMASAINNLINLSYKKGSKKLADELGYTENDLLRASNIRAYHFKINEITGKTTVQEIPNHFSIGIGFDFDIFNETNNKIYQDAVRLAEVE